MVDLPDFDTPALVRAVEALPAGAIDDLPFGAVRLAADGRVTAFSKAEARLSGFGSRPTVGKIYFTDIAPCFSTPDFLGRIERARAAGTVDIEFGVLGDFDAAAKELRVRVQSASDGGLWIFIRRL
ncbi:MAG TPA: PAS domain-containing protein [Rhodospirillaceae bacterium]|nr:PAS domain-containing protein [Rhodospirillaceae bacterium]